MKGYRGWITAYPEDKIRLQALGVKLGPYCAETQSFEDCIVTEEAFKKLEPYWGTYLWGLGDLVMIQ